MKKIITKDNILELSMISIHTFKALNAKGTKNSYEGEKFAWMSFNGIEFIVHNKEISIFLDIHKAEICFNPKTNFLVFS